MKNKVFSIMMFLALSLIIICVLAPVEVYADIGPKPSVVVDFKGLEDEIYYVTLLSSVTSTGPYSVIDYRPWSERYMSSDYEVLSIFASYDDQDGYYFLNYFADLTGATRYVWGYYPPQKFKLLLYFPEHDIFIIGEEVYEQYALHSYYTVDATDLKIQSTSVIKDKNIVKSYDHTWEIISLFARILGTIAIELLIALLFGFRTKKHLLIIGTVNIITQLILNILLNISNYYYGSIIFVLNYIGLEVLIIVIEAKAYFILFSKHKLIMPIQKGKVYCYAVVANIVSFAVGIYIAYLLPGIF